MKLSDIASVLNIPCVDDEIISGICIDSRKINPGNLFVAIAGERFDAHQFVFEVAQKGAAAVLCTRKTDNLPIPQLVVPDVVQALADIAKHHRQVMNCKVIALTGSNGKTTVKEMISSILPKPAFATPGNLNNHIGVPLSVLQLQPEHRYAVFELGASHIGEIAHTVSIVQPQVALINNIAPAHIGGFGSIEGVARAKGEIYQGLPEDGIAVVNEDDAWAHFHDDVLAQKTVIRFSAKNKAMPVYARNVCLDEEGCARFTLVLPAGEADIVLAVPGIHHVNNALAAASCTWAAGIDLQTIAAGLCRFSGVAGRMTLRQGINRSVIIDDTYNANLRSVLTALDVLAARKGRRVFVFGDMGELGDWEEQHHRDVGIAARDHGIDVVMTCGKSSEATSRAFGGEARHYTEQASLVADLLSLLNEKTTVLVKGSRSSAMEKIVQQIIERAPADMVSCGH